MPLRTVIVNDRMQQGYVYALVEPEGCNFDPEFRPELTPADMLKLGVFGGKYLTDCRNEFPASWFKGAKLSPERSDPSLKSSPDQALEGNASPRSPNRARLREGRPVLPPPPTRGVCPPTARVPDADRTSQRT